MEKARNDWSNHIEAIRTQGISTRAYAKGHDLGLSALYYWQRKLKSTPAVDRKAEPLAANRSSSKFIALRKSEPERAAPPAPTHCTLVLAGGMRLEMPALPSPQWLADLARCAQGAH